MSACGNRPSFASMCPPGHACVLAPELQRPDACCFLRLLDQRFVELVQREGVNLGPQQQEVFGPFPGARRATFGLEEPIEAEQSMQVLLAAHDDEASAAKAAEEVGAVRPIAGRAMAV